MNPLATHWAGAFVGVVVLLCCWGSATYATATAEAPRHEHDCDTPPSCETASEFAFEIPIASAPLNAAEQRALRLIQRWGRQHQLRLHVDARLNRTAAQWVASVPLRTGESIDMLSIQRSAQRWGWTDGQLAAVALRVSDIAMLDKTLRAQLDAQARHLDVNRVGLAIHRPATDTRSVRDTNDDTLDDGDADELAILVLLSRHLVQLQPVPAAVPPGSTVRIAGTIVTPKATHARITMVTAFASHSPSASGMTSRVKMNETERRDLDVHGKAFAHELTVSATPGVLDVQILIDRGRGPEIACAFPVEVGVGTHREAKTMASQEGKSMPHRGTSHAHAVRNVESTTGPASSALSSAMRINRSPQATERALTKLIYKLRQQHGLPMPSAHGKLADAARSHAQEMQQQGFFAHRSPNSGQVTDRLRARGVHYAHVLENIAIGESANAIIDQWLHSPAHRATLLAPDVDAFGVGVDVEHLPLANPALAPANANATNAAAAKIYAVLIVARLADDGPIDRLRQTALHHLNQARHAVDLPLLQPHPRLHQIADDHSRKMAALGRLVHTSDKQGDLAKVVLREIPLARAAADVYLTNTLQAVEQSPHLREDFAYAGIGIYQDRSRAGAHLWITVIYAAN